MRRRDRFIFALGVAGAGTLATVMFIVALPVIFVPGLWRGYTAWGREDVE